MPNTVISSEAPKGGAQDVFQGPEPTALKGKSIRGGAIALGSQALMFVLQTGSTILLARLLTPSDFGLQGMVLALTGFLGVFRDAGLGVVTVQKEGVTHEQTSTLFWINVGLGGGLAILIALASPVLASFYHEPRLVGIAVVSSLAFLFGGLSVQHRALMYRSMRFATLAKIDASALVVSVAIGLVMARAGYGYWALVATAVSSPLIAMVAVWVAMPWIPCSPARGANVKPLLQMGQSIILNSLVVYIAYNTEKILLGRYWGASALGIYGRAYQLANLPVQQLNSSINSVAFPALARLQGDVERLARSFWRGYGIVVSVTVPVPVICGVFAEEIVSVILGAKWSEASPIFRYLAPSILSLALINPLGWFLQATGRVKRNLYLALLIAPVVIVGIVAGLSHGPVGVATGYSVAMLLLIAPIVIWALHETGLELRDYFRSVKAPLVGSSLAGVAAFGLKLWLAASLPAWLVLIIGSLAFAVVYGGVVMWGFDQKEMYLDLFRELFRRRTTAED